MDYSKTVSEGLSRTIQQQPFIASVLMEMMEIVEDPNLPNEFATDGKHVFVNPDLAGQMQLDERVFGFAHEAFHPIMEHLTRGEMYRSRGFGPDLKPFDEEKWNHACDYIINGMLTEAKIGKRPEWALYDYHIGAKDLADDVYMNLPTPPKKGGGSGPGGYPGPQTGKQRGDGRLDQHLPPSPKTPSKTQVKQAVAAAKAAAKSMGKMPAVLEAFLSEVLEPSLNWREVLRAMMTANQGKDTSTWQRTNRRKLALPPHIIFPGSTGFATGGVCVVMDCSGSVSHEETAQFLGELSSILDECRPEWCKVLWTDTRVGHVDEVDSPADLADLRAHDGGGTDMTAAFRYIEDEGLEPETVVVLTDGYTPFGDDQPFDVIWGITAESIVAPHGKTVHVDVSKHAA